MNGKKKFYAEFAYLIGIVVLAVGTSLMEKADFGMSMVVAPAYIIYLKVSEYVGWFSFGMAEYCFQAFLLVVIGLVMRRFKVGYLFSFCTALFYGIVLDFCMIVAGRLPADIMWLRVVYYLVGMMVCAVGVAFLFHTYIAPEAYELMVKEIATGYKQEIHKVKTIYDLSSCLLAVLLSFAFFGLGRFEGVKLGTVICAVVNGFLISRVSLLLDKRFDFCRGIKAKGQNNK